MKVVIVGYGVEGKASYNYWRALEDEVAIADERLELPNAPESARLLLGPSAFRELDELFHGKRAVAERGVQMQVRESDFG